MESAERTKHGKVNLTKAVKDLQRKLKGSVNVASLPMDVNKPSTSINIRPTTSPSSPMLKNSSSQEVNWKKKKEIFENKIYTSPFFSMNHYRNVRYGQDLYLKPHERYRKPQGAKLTSAQILEKLEQVSNPPGYMGKRDDIRIDTTKTDRAAINMTANEKLLRKFTYTMFDDKLVDFIGEARSRAAGSNARQDERKTTIRFKDYSMD